jgi:hypothetical protein
VPADEPSEEAGRHDTVPIASRRGPRRVPDLPPGVGEDVPAEAGPRAVGDPATQPVEPVDEATGAQATAPEPVEQHEAVPDRAAGRSGARGAPARTAGKGRASKRATVPSWDEILFGGPKRDQD